MLDDALKLRRQNFSVIPVTAREKIASVAWKQYQAALADEETIRNWFDNSESNIGIVTGAASNCVVLDIDDDKGGSQSLEAYEIPVTPCAKTGSGWHYYFRHPGFDVSNFAGKLPGVDLRGDGGYAVAPPSVHPNGKSYEWIVSPEHCALAEMPKWLLDLCAANDNVAKATSYGEAWFDDCDALAEAEPGQRNDLLNQVACKAGSLSASGNLDRSSAIDAMMDACKRNGLLDADGAKSVRDTIRSGLLAGMKNPRGPEPKLPPTGGLKLTKASAIKPERIDWLWPGVLAKGKLCIIAGDPGLGKSQVSASIAAMVSRGLAWPASEVKCKPGNVIMFSAEDGVADTIVPRLIAAGADLERIHVHSASDEPSDRSFNLKRDIHALRNAVEAMGECSLIVIDPIASYLGGADSNNNSEIREILGALQAIQEQYGTCVLGVHHLNKKAGSQAAYRLSGSLAFVAAARSAFIVERDGADKELRLMAPAKVNIAKDTVSFAYRIQSQEIEGGIEAPTVIWEKYSDSRTADDVLAEKDDGGALGEAENMLREMLADGPTHSSECYEEARTRAIAERTLDRAKTKLGVRSKRDGKRWMWSLPE